ncbi:hypothetical protein PVK06_030462 [Gossypium arboreum]|uniref:Uncharacterized protein n=1 Tax=Gossypium arboreum TaxID=29729 RepID=A0ABR0NP99_GOSAR|nr:hypothetical protein PVK06_030462 [Gossypium arboreum]
MSEDDKRKQSLLSDPEFIVMAFAFFFRRLMAFFSESVHPDRTTDLKSKFKQYLNVGPFILATPPPSAPDPYGCLTWLNKQKPATVVYISFGSVVTPPLNELVALAEAVEASQVPFIWSLRDKSKNDHSILKFERDSRMGVFPFASSIHFVEKDYKLADTVIRGLLKYWPLTNCQKEVLFLGELEEVLEATQSVEFQRCMVPLFKQIARCLNSLHFQRITIVEILQDEWFKKGYKPPKFEQDDDVNLDDNILYFTWL